MTGFQGQVIGHLVRRGYGAAQTHFSSRVSDDTMAKLRHDAELYENSGPEMEMSPWSILPIVLTAVLVLLITEAVRYTLGHVMASLTMIESATATAVIEDKPPAYADEPDAPLEKEPLMPAEAEADLEVTVIPNKPVTAKIRTTLRLLRQVGGFRAMWRGLPFAIIYNLAHFGINNGLSNLAAPDNLVAQSLLYVLTSFALSRLHMFWTHSMIAHPSSKPFYKRVTARTHVKHLYIPAMVAAAAEQATFILPMMVASAVGVGEIGTDYVMDAAHHGHCRKAILLGLRFLAVPATALFVAFAILLPAIVSLTRIEALLLLETEDTIVPFDRQAIVGDIDLAARGSARKLFVSAWRSFDRASRWRLIKLYVKMVMIQISVLFIGLHVMVAEVFIIGGEKLGLLFKSGAAQIQLMLLEAQENPQ